MPSPSLSATPSTSSAMPSPSESVSCELGEPSPSVSAAPSTPFGMPSPSTSGCVTHKFPALSAQEMLSLSPMDVPVAIGTCPVHMLPPPRVMTTSSTPNLTVTAVKVSEIDKVIRRLSLSTASIGSMLLETMCAATCGIVASTLTEMLGNRLMVAAFPARSTSCIVRSTKPSGSDASMVYLDR